MTIIAVLLDIVQHMNIYKEIRYFTPSKYEISALFGLILYNKKFEFKIEFFIRIDQ